VIFAPAARGRSSLQLQAYFTQRKMKKKKGKLRTAFLDFPCSSLVFLCVKKPEIQLVRGSFEGFIGFRVNKSGRAQMNTAASITTPSASVYITTVDKP
jgi:hypothetical protein